MRLSLLAALIAAAGLAVAPAASAYKLAPPGNSAVSQYVENVPGAKGNVPSNSIHSHGGSGVSGAVTPSTQRALAGHGADGARAAALAAATAPTGARGENRRHRTAEPGRGAVNGIPVSTSVKGSVASPASAVLSAVTGSATHGLGALLPAILLASAIGAGLLAVVRRRRRT